MADREYEVIYDQRFTKSLTVMASSQKEAIEKAKRGDVVEEAGDNLGPTGPEINWHAKLFEAEWPWNRSHPTRPVLHPAQDEAAPQSQGSSAAEPKA